MSLASTHKSDVVIVGAGIAGLFTFHLLAKKGYDVTLLTHGDIGGEQSLASQGMIHGGQKYNLHGKTSAHSMSIEHMPRIWNECFAGTGIINLEGTKFLSQQQIIWSTGALTENVAAFLASKAMNAKVSLQSSKEWPSLFQKAGKNFKGKIYTLPELVIDVKSLTQKLISPYASRIHRGSIKEIYQDNEKITGLSCEIEGSKLEVKAQHYIFCAGAGNEEILRQLNFSNYQSLTQRRPLRQIIVKTMQDPIYGHCITTDPRPRVTITAHPAKDGYIWYLGGLVAENSATKNHDEAVIAAQKELSNIFPWVNWKDKDWDSFIIDRAEPYSNSLTFKTDPYIITHKNGQIAWPMKLTFAPALALELLENLIKEGLKPKIAEKSTLPCNSKIGKFPWEEKGYNAV